MSESCKGVLLIVDDEPLKRVTLQIELSEAGYVVLEAPDARSAIQQLRSQPIDVVLTDLRMPEIDGLQLLDQIKAAGPQTHVIMMTAYASVDSAVDAMKRGAVDYLTKPFQTTVLLEKLDCLRSSRHWNTHHAAFSHVDRIGTLVGRSYAARSLFDQVRTVAGVDRPVLIQGELGTGKGGVAAAIHELGRRAQQPFVSLVCPDVESTSLEVELFGRLTTALGSGGRVGALKAADGGTLFLDQVDALPIEMQPKLLRFLERGEIDHNGGAERTPVDVRFLCATQKNLRQLVDAGQFREDLYYRLAALSVTVPPLRERRQDIPLIVEQLLGDHAARGGAGDSDAGRQLRARITPHAMEKLMAYHWPGNLRELEYTIERAVALASLASGTPASCPEIAPKDIVLEQDQRSVAWAVVDGGVSDAAGACPGTVGSGLTETIAGVESSLINAALRRAAGNQAKAAQFLGIPRTTLRDKMAKYGMAVARREAAQQEQE